MSLIQSARMSRHDPHAYLKDMLNRLPEYKASPIEVRLPFRWQPTDI
jgi:transposase